MLLRQSKEGRSLEKIYSDSSCRAVMVRLLKILSVGELWKKTLRHREEGRTLNHKIFCLALTAGQSQSTPAFQGETKKQVPSCSEVRLSAAFSGLASIQWTDFPQRGHAIQHFTRKAGAYLDASILTPRATAWGCNPRPDIVLMQRFCDSAMSLADRYPCQC